MSEKWLVPVTAKVTGSTVPSTSKSTKLSFSGVISVSAIECASRIR